MNKITWLLAAFFWAASTGFAGQTAAVDTAVITPNETANTLNFLIERAVESEKGYEEAAARVRYAGLKVRLLSASIQREHFAKQLQDIVVGLEQTSVSEEIFTNRPYSPWFGSGDIRIREDRDVLVLIKPREEKMLSAYQNALNQKLPPDIREVVQKQADQVESLYKWLEKNAAGK